MANEFLNFIINLFTLQIIINPLVTNFVVTLLFSGLVLTFISIAFITGRVPSDKNRFGDKGEAMSIDSAVRSFFRNYFNFKGRASRSEYWYSQLFIHVTAISLALCGLLGLVSGMLFTLVTIIPLVAVTTRRLHDINRSGWYQLLALLSLLGTVVVFTWMCTQPHDAQPKAKPRAA